MSIFSASLSISGSFSTARVSYSSASCSRISRVSCGFSVRRSRRHCPCAIYASNVRAMGGLVEDKRASVLALGLGSQQEVGHSRVFLDVRSEEELLSGLRKEVESGRLPSNIADRMEEVYHNYRNAVLQSGNPKAREIILSNMAVAFDRMLLDVEDPFTFSPYHEAIREPFDYYVFGQKYIRPLIDFRRSYVGNIKYFYEIEKKLQKGDNVVFISNHQTEADPAVIALLLETTTPHLAENMTYIAGDRVVTDPVCKPFSMGRNLFCVYSKKHMNDNPELAEMKKRANTRSLKEMVFLLRTGARIIWIAPSGGRDRPDPSTGEWFPAPFDSSSVDNIRRLLDHSGVPGHVYPLALLCHDIMPPPLQVEKQIGERRLISYHGVGLSVAPEMSFNGITAGIEKPEEAAALFSQALYTSVIEQYNVLKSAINENKGLEASNSLVTLSQPWK
ncbi:hypothetical protein MRB53_003559 [Persea americana]|uniref:Uncharacterized protein n=1 Tax=Persea americana TaxID=3435 RepID=A0ACC2MXX5_PERAE|nr:hypothetical protein MRB53_003559 [Persea americana]|eukprot:TRINITY_DN6708_c0_g1_i5.p1 TRINITY_DN6708_c0_g1~~TRINITY_DN6708_c0_g1_i5.p1  ORF type:complete len:447 (+),score=88.27 TRINITY_DN6708_c0_g1_i5:409-1749(+)